MIRPLTDAEITALNSIAQAVHDNAAGHGFHNFEESDGQFITRAMLLINTETAELFEAYRNGTLLEPCDKSPKMEAPLNNEAEEIADIIIRALDYAKRRGIEIGNAVAIKHKYNTERPFRHGNKLA